MSSTTPFSVEACTALNELAPNAHIHVIGVCGVAMAQLSVALVEYGFTVSGSDKEYYDPMRSLLAQCAVSTMTGFAATNIPPHTALVVIGNAVSRDNPEVLETQRRNIPYTIFPKILGDFLIADRQSIVIAGTHGKSTTTALGAHVLSVAQAQPSFFVGGLMKGYERCLVIGAGDVSIVEGDEYDSAFFAKVPKFSFYKPNLLTITSLEFDHADIYEDLAAIEAQFQELIACVPASGQVLVCLDDPNIEACLPRWRTLTAAPIRTYGFHEKADVRITAQQYHDGVQHIEIRQEGSVHELQLSLLGKHNARNAVAIYLTMKHRGMTDAVINQGLSTFPGVRRRQEVRYQNQRTIVLEDFAHHPTAVRETLAAIRQGYPHRRIVCAFEPRSNTSRRKVFEHDYGSAFKDAAVVYLKSVAARHNDSGIELMDIGVVAQEIERHGSKVHLFESTTSLLSSLGAEDTDQTLIVVMSNGSFDGLIDSLIACLADRDRK
jgi:UDP-N-acetylmuramate: L-alanyl-gamma-D-glutamyl-meso-diaminopimelate ligase